MMSSLFHDDITWCMEDHCPVVGCDRNPVNMMDHTGLHSFSAFKGTEYCPAYRNSDAGCMEICVHVQECFSNIKDPGEALRILQKEYCDHCVFASVEED